MPPLPCPMFLERQIFRHDNSDSRIKTENAVTSSLRNRLKRNQTTIGDTEVARMPPTLKDNTESRKEKLENSVTSSARNCLKKKNYRGHRTDPDSAERPSGKHMQEIIFPIFPRIGIFFIPNLFSFVFPDAISPSFA